MAGDAADAAADNGAADGKNAADTDKPAEEAAGKPAVEKPVVDERTPEEKAADEAAAAVKAKEDAEVARVEAEKAALAAAEVKVDDAKKAVAATQEGPDAQPEGDPAANAALSKAESELKVLTDKRDAELAAAAALAHTAQLNAELEFAGKPKELSLPANFKLKEEKQTGESSHFKSRIFHSYTSSPSLSLLMALTPHGGITHHSESLSLLDAEEADQAAPAAEEAEAGPEDAGPADAAPEEAVPAAGAN